VPVKTLFDHLASDDLNEFYAGFPNVTHEMVTTVLDSARNLIELEISMRKSA
jgi:hypothetical protein